MFIGNKASDVLCIKMVARYKDIYLCGNQTCWPRVYSGNFVICLRSTIMFYWYAEMSWTTTNCKESSASRGESQHGKKPDD